MSGLPRVTLVVPEPFLGERLDEAITIRTPLRFSPKLRLRLLRPLKLPTAASRLMVNPGERT